MRDGGVFLTTTNFQGRNVFLGNNIIIHDTDNGNSNGIDGNRQ